MEVTSHPLAAADLHIREPRKPFPPATTSLFFVACAMLDSMSLFMGSYSVNKYITLQLLASMKYPLGINIKALFANYG